jgi:MFS family permease
MNNHQSWPMPAQAWYAVGILVIAFIFSFVDRIIIGLLVGPLKADLNLTDTQFGLLQGIAFAFFYAAVGLPIGRLADRYSRRKIIGVGIFVWSIMTAFCGLARNFWQLFFARVGVGLGEAALSPAAYSMIADYFPPQKIGRALGIYQSGAFFGAGISFLVGGLVIKMATGAADLSLPLVGIVRPWQIVFFVVGLPGILVALLMWTVTEPERKGVLTEHADGIPLRDVIRYTFKENWRVFLAHFGGFALLAVPITTALTWMPAYFIRVHGYTMPQVGWELGWLLLFLSPTGVYAGGWLTDKLQQRGYTDATLRVGIFAALMLFPLSYLAATAASATAAIWLFGPFIFFASLSMAVAPAALQVVAPNQMRAQISATWMLFLNLVTAGIGPTAVGFITDFWFGDDMAVGQSIALVNCVSVPLGALLLWSGLKPFRAAVARRLAG